MARAAWVLSFAVLLAILIPSLASRTETSLLLTNQLSSCKPWSVPPEQRCSYVIEHFAACYPDGGIQSYLKLHYCSFEKIQWMSWIIIVVSILVSFGFLLTSAERFFCPALEVISDYLRLSPAVAGATLLSFGNGAPDVFTQIAAVRGGDPAAVGMALAEPLGGGLFTSNVVLGFVVLLSSKNRRIKVQKGNFLKDLVFYIFSLLLMVVVLWDQKVLMWEAALLMVMYVLYVVATFYVARGDEPVHADIPNHELPPEELVGGVDSCSECTSEYSSPRCRPSPHGSRAELLRPLLNGGSASGGSNPSNLGQQREQGGRHPSGTAAGLLPGPADIEQQQPQPQPQEPAQQQQQQRVESWIEGQPNAELGGPGQEAADEASQMRGPSVAGEGIGCLTSGSTLSLPAAVAVVAVPDGPMAGAPPVRAIKVSPSKRRMQQQGGQQDPPQLEPAGAVTVDMGGNGSIRLEAQQSAGEQQQQQQEEHSSHYHRPLSWHHRLQQPFMFGLALTMPRVGSAHAHHYPRWRAVLLPFSCPLFLVLANGLHGAINMGGYAYGACCSLVGALVIAAVYPEDGIPRGRLKGVFASLAFILSVVWLNVSAGAVVELSTMVGKIIGVNPGLLGATILAWGNSGPDLVNNVSMGRDGFPTMAITACFASPLFSLLVGMAIALAYGVALNHGVLHVQLDTPLKIMYGFAAVNLIKFLVFVPLVYRFTLGPKMAVTAFVFYLVYNVVYGLAQCGVL